MSAGDLTTAQFWETLNTFVYCTLALGSMQQLHSRLWTLERLSADLRTGATVPPSLPLLESFQLLGPCDFRDVSTTCAVGGLSANRLKHKDTSELINPTPVRYNEQS